MPAGRQKCIVESETRTGKFPIEKKKDQVGRGNGTWNTRFQGKAFPFPTLTVSICEGKGMS
jgi:hypothetical protein